MHKIVIIDDSNLIRMRLTKALQQNGYFNVISFDSAEVIGKNPQLYLNDVELIITDIWLPGMSGIELSRILNSYPKYCDIPIIFISVSSDMKTINEAVKAGAIDYLVKPFEDKLLIERVKKVLDKSNTDEQFFNDVERIKMVISMEYERTVRGHQPLSFIKLIVNKEDIQNCIKLIMNIIRKIDMVFVIEKKIIIILPLTDNVGLNIAFDKINNQLFELNIKVIEKYLLTLTSDSSLSINDLFEAIL